MTIKSVNIVVPLKNEEKSVKVLIDNLKPVIDKIKIKTIISLIDDQSSDQTLNLLEEYRQKFNFIKIHKSENTPGFGGAVKFAIKKNEEDAVIIFMGDCSDDPNDIIEYVKYLDTDTR